jgi:hypothetical protein
MSMQNNKVFADLVERPETLKLFSAGYGLIIRDAMDNNFYYEAAEHKTNLNWIENAIRLIIGGWRITISIDQKDLSW